MSIIKVKDPFKVVQSTNTYQGNSANQTYSINPFLVKDDSYITIIDQGGDNVIELVGGLTIISSVVTSNETLLTLSNGAKINVRGADAFVFNVGGNSAGGVEGVDKTFSEFSSDILNITLPAYGDRAIESTGELSINSDGSTTGELSSDSSSTINPEAFSHTNNALGDLSTLSSEGVSSLASGTYWDENYSTITYSFNDTIPPSYYDYGAELTEGFVPLDGLQRDTVREITGEINDILGITFQEVSDDGLVRFSVVEMEENTAAFAFYPGEFYGCQGDVFLSKSYFNDNVSESYLDHGQDPRLTITHELGHALGLKHPFEGDDTLPTELDNHAHTIMSYTYSDSYKLQFTVESDGSNISAEYVDVLPQLYSIYDVSALQAIYGVNDTTNRQNNTYTFSYTNPEYQTLWDAGGVDTLDLSANLGDTVLDLNGGSLNSIDVYTIDEIVQYHQTQVDTPHYNSWIESIINDLYADNQLYTGENNIAIANGTIIENVTTGSGNDTITDNEVDNIINASFGDDIIHVGHGGYDIVDGAEGVDVLYVDLLQSEVTVENFNGDYLLYTDTYGVKFENIEFITFQGVTMYAPDDLIV